MEGVVRGPDTGTGWRGETTASVVCLLLLPGWLWVTGGNLNEFRFVGLSVLLGVGVRTGLSGVRRGDNGNRGVAGLCLLIHGGFAAFLICFMSLVWATKAWQRW